MSTGQEYLCDSPYSSFSDHGTEGESSDVPDSDDTEDGMLSMCHVTSCVAIYYENNYYGVYLYHSLASETVMG